MEAKVAEGEVEPKGVTGAGRTDVDVVVGVRGAASEAEEVEGEEAGGEGREPREGWAAEEEGWGMEGIRSRK